MRHFVKSSPRARGLTSPEGNPIELRRRQMGPGRHQQRASPGSVTTAIAGDNNNRPFPSLALPHAFGDGEDASGDDGGPPSVTCSETLSFVLSNEDIHSLEAFLFAVRATVFELSQLQKSLIALYHAEEIANRQ